ncbi:N-acyl homoserine lactonase family protein [Marinobacterium nitratireducens]|uniref:N-acyl homoserine lactonase family protein n=1 Tax=Marinobacterium nitratireducens TaxID=518897 RepID=A0A917Z8V0_9GAMM|nr:N-acyl homoserine lactonase family protein [Marinobacterium nitratireducens]GGO76409.1 N-acyl homoserine lactonase family protein [Marinobacterium nitratireducens]
MFENNIEPFSVYAIKYATVQRNASDNFIGSDPHDSATSMDYYVWVARSKEHLFLIDTGFDAQRAISRRRIFLRCPTEGLSLLGIDRSDVESIIITHMHYDHAGNLSLFKNARFFIQDSEVAYVTGRSMRHSFLRQAYELEDVLDVVRYVHTDRVNFIDGNAELVPGLRLHHIGGHCAGLQIVQVWTKQGWMVLASDASHYYENFESKRPFPIVLNVHDMLEGHAKLNELASSPSLIIPGHDPRVMERYNAPSEEMEGIVVQLA